MSPLLNCLNHPDLIKEKFTIFINNKLTPGIEKQKQKINTCMLRRHISTEKVGPLRVQYNDERQRMTPIRT